MKQLHLFISGRVQGVGYRQFVLHHAMRLGITGFVTNLSDGRVEVVVQGDQTAIKQLVQLCRKGTGSAEVTQLDHVWEEKEETFQEFLIV